MDDQSGFERQRPEDELENGLRGRIRAALGRSGELPGRELLELAEALNQQGKQVSDALADLSRREREAERVRENLERTVRDSGRALDERNARLTALAGRLELERDRLAERAGQLESVESELEGRTQALDSALGELGALRSRLAELESVADAAERSPDPDRGRAAEQLASLDGVLDHVRGGLEGATARLERIESRDAELEGLVQSLAHDPRVDEVERALGELRERLERMSQTLAGRERALADRERALADAAAAERERTRDREDRLARAARLAGELFRVLSGSEPEERPTGVEAVEAEQPEESLAAAHVLYVQTPGGYRLVEREGAPPQPGEWIDVDELAGVRAEVTGVARSPLPGDRRPCAACVAAVS